MSKEEKLEAETKLQKNNAVSLTVFVLTVEWRSLIL